MFSPHKYFYRVFLIGLILLVGFMFFPFSAISQAEWDVEIDGRVTKGNKRLSGVTVVLLENSKKVKQVLTPANGVFNFILNPDNDYLIVMSKSGHVSKRIAFSTKNVPSKTVGGGFPSYPMEISLFEEVEGLNVSILKQPVAKYVFSKKEDDFIYDEAYSKSIQNEMSKMMKELEVKKKEAAAKAKAEAKSKSEAAAKKAEEERLAKEAAAKKAEKERLAKEAAAKNAEEERLAKEASAKKVKEEELARNAAAKKAKEERLAKEAAAKKAEEERLAREAAAKKAKEERLAREAAAKKVKEEELARNATAKKAREERLAKEAAKIKEEKYERAIAKANNSFDAKDYQNAKGTYQEALNIKPKAQYPKNKIKEINAIVAVIKADENMKAREETDRAKAEAVEKKKKEAAKRAAEARIKAEQTKEKKNISDALSESERKRQFLSELAKKYPEGVTEEIIVEGNKKIIRRIVVYEGNANEYKKIIYPYGVFYKKNGTIDLTEHTFEVETTNWLDN